MSKYSIKKKEQKEVAIATFHNENDYKVVKLLNGKTTILHKIQADKLIELKRAEVVKGEAIVSKTGKRTTVVVDEEK